MILTQQPRVGLLPWSASSGGGGGGATGDLFNEDFEAGNLTQFSLVTSSGTVTNVTSAGTAPYAGSRCVLYDIPSNGGDGGCRADASIGSHNDIWNVFAMKIITRTLDTFPGTQKQVIFRSSGGTQLGEMNDINNGWIWNWLSTDAGAGNIDLTEYGSVSSNLGAWNTYKLRYHFLGSGLGTTITFGMNGTNVLKTIHTTQDQAATVDTITFGGTLNGGSGASKYAFDEIHIGTTDPGWP